MIRIHLLLELNSGIYSIYIYKIFNEISKIANINMMFQHFFK